MKKPNISLLTVFIIFGIFVVGILAYISILGENQQINRVITAYFDKLKEGEYLEACESFSSNFDERFANAVRPLTAAIARLDDDFKARRLDERVYREERKALETRIQQMAKEQNEKQMNFNFLLESALLTQYNLINQPDYKVELKRSNFWIPYTSDDEVRVSILLKRKEARQLLFARSNDQDGNFIENLIVMKREKRTWKIKEFAIADSALVGVYNDLRRNFDLNKYVQVTSDGFRFNSADINFKNLTPLDKRLLNFSLYKIQKLLNIPRKKTQGFPFAR
jgi:outer membrane murein-binding lipoprotein Lpp